MQRKFFRIFHRPNSHSPPPPPLLGLARPMKRPSHGTLPGLLPFFFFLISLLWRNERHFQEFVLSGPRREKKETFLYFFFLSLSSLTGLTAANRLLAKSTQIRKRRMAVRENARVPIDNDGEKKKTTVRKKRKTPEKPL